MKTLLFSVLSLALAARADISPLQCGVAGDGDDFYTSSTVSNILECQNFCNSDAKCLSSEYKPSTGACWLYAKPVAQAKTRNDTTRTWIFNDRGCLAAPLVPQCNISGDGSDYYASPTVNSLAECQSACKGDPKCLSSEYQPSNGGCWLYAGPVSQARTRNDTTGSYYFYDRNCPISLAPLLCNISGDGSSYYKSTTGNTVGDCQSACKSDPKCLSSEYKPSSGECWLYEKPVAIARTRNDTTGTYFFYDRGCPVLPRTIQCKVPGDGSSYYSSLTVDGVFNCQSACKNETRCHSSEYQPAKGGCWLYEKPVAIAKTREDTTGTYFFYDRECPLPICGANRDGSGFYTSSKTGSLKACQSTCIKDTKCLSFEYRPNNGNCWLFAKSAAESSTPSAATWVFYDRDCVVPS